MISLKMNGLKEVTHFFRELPGNVDKEVRKKGILELARNLQRRAKRRAPKGSTGWLRRSIMVEKSGRNVSVMVHAFYGAAVEKGRSRNMWIPVEYIEQHERTPEAPGNRVKDIKGWVNLMNTAAARPRPFMKPAIESMRTQIPQILNKSIQKAINKSR